MTAKPQARPCLVQEGGHSTPLTDAQIEALTDDALHVELYRESGAPNRLHGSYLNGDGDAT